MNADNIREAIDAVCNQWYAAVNAAKPYLDKAAEIAEKQMKELGKAFSGFHQN